MGLNPTEPATNTCTDGEIGKRTVTKDELTKLKLKFNIEKYKLIHKDVHNIVGIYEQKHRTNSRLLLIVRLTYGNTQTRSYPRALMEVHLGRALKFPDETVDHINNNPMDNRLKNLRVISLSDNIKKLHSSGLAYVTPKGVRVHNVDLRGSKNGKSKIYEEDVLMYRKKYKAGLETVDSIVNASKLSRRTAENFLFGRSYANVPGSCERRPHRRKNK